MQITIINTWKSAPANCFQIYGFKNMAHVQKCANTYIAYGYTQAYFLTDINVLFLTK